jgi:long-chain acyl-CoA synthetase
VRSLAAGFLAAGIQPGERVALLAATSYEWTLVDYALWTVAAVPVPIYETSSAEQIRWVLEDTGPVAGGSN